MKINNIQPKSTVSRFLWLWLWGPINMVITLTPLLAINFFQFPSLLILPFSKNKFRAYNRKAAATIWGWWAWSLTKVIGLKVELSGDQIPPEENAIVISNHQGMGDIPVLLCLAINKGRMGDIKWMVKDILKYVPGLGWGMLFLECVFLKRSWTEDKNKIVLAFERFRRDQIPLWMILFPEGTRLTPEKLKRSQDFAAQNNMLVPTHTLIPRTKGFTMALTGLKDYIKVIYSVTIAYERQAPGFLSLMRGDVKKVRCHVQRIMVDEIPDDTVGVSNWLYENFHFKDRILEQFKQTALT